MRYLLLLCLGFASVIAYGQKEFYLTAGSDLLVLPTTTFVRPVGGSNSSLGRGSVGFGLGVELDLLGERGGGSPITVGVRYGVLLGASLMADFSGEFDYCGRDGTVGTSSVLAQRRFEGANFWQVYASKDLFRWKGKRPGRFALGGGFLLMGKQRTHTAISQLNPETGRPEQPGCRFAFTATEEGGLTAESTPGLGVGSSASLTTQNMLRSVSPYLEIKVAIRQGVAVESIIGLQIGITPIVDEALYGDRLRGSRWIALSTLVRGKIF